MAIDRKTGRRRFTRVRTVVEDEELENYQAELTVEQAKQYMEDPEVGEQLIEEVPPVEMGRIAAQSAKQVILQKVREAERDRQYRRIQGSRRTDHQRSSSNARNTAMSSSMSAAVKASCGATKRSAVKAIAPTTASAATSRTCAAKPRAADLPVAAPHPNSWPSCSRWKCRKSTTVSSRSRPSPVTPVARQDRRHQL